MDITIYDIKVYMWKVITYGYFAQILFVIGILFLCFTLFFLLGHYNIIRYAIKEKFNFLKNYLYHFLQEKYYFIKYYIGVMLDYYNRSKVLVIVGTGLIIIFITIYIIIKFTKT